MSHENNKGGTANAIEKSVSTQIFILPFRNNERDDLLNENDERK